MSAANPRVSVVVATYNCAELLGVTLRSAQAQTFSDFEVLVVGDGCTDSSADSVAALQDSRFQWINLESNHRAPHAAHNEGLRRARAGLVAYLNHDDLWFPWHLERLVSTITGSAGSFVKAMTAQMEPDGSVSSVGRTHDRRKWIPACPTTWLHRRELFENGLDWRDPYVVGEATDTNFLSRASDRIPIDFLAELTSLKFVSGNWRPYSRTDVPQREFLERLLHQPDALHREVLERIADAKSASDYRLYYPTLGWTVRALARNAVKSLAAFYGWERFPAPALRRAIFRRRRGAYNRARGPRQGLAAAGYRSRRAERILTGGARVCPSAGAAWMARTIPMPRTTRPNAAKP